MAKLSVTKGYSISWVNQGSAWDTENESGGKPACSLVEEYSSYQSLDAILNTYLVVLGHYDLIDNYSNRNANNARVMWVIFIFTTFMLQITFFNMLISIMTDIYSKVTQKRR